MFEITLKLKAFFSVFAAIFALQTSAFAQDTRPIVFITELVRDLGAVSEIRDRAGDDIEKDQGDPFSMMQDCIKNSTSLILERRFQIEQLQQLKLSDPFSFLVPAIVSSWSESLSLDERMVDLCKTIFKGSDAIKDIQFAAGEIPEIAAKMDYLDKAFFDSAMRGAILTLVSQTPDSQGHMSLLVISKAEKNDLIREIELTFGNKLKVKNPKYLVASIVMLRHFLDNGHKTTD